MDVTIERILGRARLISVLCDKRRYLSMYNLASMQSSANGGEALPRWAARLADAFS